MGIRVHVNTVDNVIWEVEGVVFFLVVKQEGVANCSDNTICSKPFTRKLYI